MLTLDQLDQAFERIWQNPEQMPAQLHQWQLDLSDYIADHQDDQQTLAILEPRLAGWQKTLGENRQLFEAHQISLKEDLKRGEPIVPSETIRKKFN
jgi:hypothetical protein